MVCVPPENTSSSLLPHRYFKGFLVSRSYIVGSHVCCLHSTAHCSLTPPQPGHLQRGFINCFLYNCYFTCKYQKGEQRIYTHAALLSQNRHKATNKSRPFLEIKKHQEETGSFHKEHRTLDKQAWD